MELSILSEEGGVTHVSVAGKITQEQTAVAADALGDLLGEGAYARKVILNMQDVDFMDSSGVSWLLIAHKRFKEGNGRLVLHSVPPVVSNVLKVLRMHLVFELADGKDEAMLIIRGEAT